MRVARPDIDAVGTKAPTFVMPSEVQVYILGLKRWTAWCTDRRAIVDPFICHAPAMPTRAPGTLV